MFKVIIFSIIATFQAYGSDLTLPTFFTWHIPQTEIITPPQLPILKINPDLFPKPYTPRPTEPKFSERKWGDPSER